MDKENYDLIEEFGAGNELYFYYVLINNKWGIIDIDHQEITPCIHSKKPELVHFEEFFKSDIEDKNRRLFYPDFYAYQLIFKALGTNNKYGIYFFIKTLMPDSNGVIKFSDYIYDDVRIIGTKNKIQVVKNKQYKDYSFNEFLENVFK